MNKFSSEVRERAMRMILDGAGQHGSRWQAIMSIAAKIGCSANTLNDWVEKAEVDNGRRAGIPAEMTEKSEPLSAIGPRTMASALERENRELRQGEPKKGNVRWTLPRRTRSCARAKHCPPLARGQCRARILRWRSSTAGRSDGGVH